MDKSEMRIERIRSGGQFGCRGQHVGLSNLPGCPAILHHHHDAFCDQPTKTELEIANRPSKWALDQCICDMVEISRGRMHAIDCPFND